MLAWLSLATNTLFLASNLSFDFITDTNQLGSVSFRANEITVCSKNIQHKTFDCKKQAIKLRNLIENEGYRILDLKPDSLALGKNQGNQFTVVVLNSAGSEKRWTISNSVRCRYLDIFFCLDDSGYLLKLVETGLPVRFAKTDLLDVDIHFVIDVAKHGDQFYFLLGREGKIILIGSDGKKVSERTVTDQRCVREDFTMKRFIFHGPKSFLVSGNLQCLYRDGDTPRRKKNYSFGFAFHENTFSDFERNRTVLLYRNGKVTYFK